MAVPQDFWIFFFHDLKLENASNFFCEYIGENDNIYKNILIC